jgi:hypothetical protein
VGVENTSNRSEDGWIDISTISTTNTYARVDTSADNNRGSDDGYSGPKIPTSAESDYGLRVCGHTVNNIRVQPHIHMVWMLTK